LFDDRVFRPDMSDYCGNVRLFNASICNDSNAVMGSLRRRESIVKVLNMRK